MEAGEILLRRGLLDRRQLEESRRRNQDGVTIVDAAVELGFVSEEDALKMQKTGTLPAPVKAVIAIPTQIVDGLIQALQAQRDKRAEGGKPSSGTTVQ